MSSRRVVITGIGVLAPNGVGKEAFWAALKEGKSGVRQITLFDTTGLPTDVAGEVSDFEPRDFMPARLVKERGRTSHFAIAAARLAMEDAGLPPGHYTPEKFGLNVGMTFPAMDQVQYHIHRTFIAKKGELPREAYPMYTAVSPNMATLDITEVLGISGSRITFANACSSGALAIAHAYREIMAGKSEAYLAGGLDACLTYHMYAALISSGFQVVSSRPPEKISRPYDKKREGAICSEGAAFVVLEELHCAERRGARPYGEIVGVGEGFERPSHKEIAVRRGLARSMLSALDEAGLSPRDVDYVCSHGPSLIAVDEMETLAIKDVFGKAAYSIPVSSIKSMIGNPMAASGPMQVAAALLAMNDSTIPPTINLDFPDPACDLDYVPNKARRNRVELSLVDSHGLDNVDVSIILARCER